MNKLKEMTLALREHLNRDERGKTLLADVERVANDQRKELAGAKERICELEVALSRARNQLDADRESNASYARLAEEERTKRKQSDKERDDMESRLAEAKREIASLQPEELQPFKIAERQRPRLRKSLGVSEGVVGKLIEPRKLTGVFNQLRKDVGVCPEPTSKHGPRTLAYRLDDIVSDLSVGELIKLGRFVACMALFNFPAEVVSDYTIAPDTHTVESLRPFIHWLRRSIDTEKTDKYYLPRTGKSGNPITSNDIL